ncbi:hypothetical protein MVEG_12166 [Podila verticillata NRRL 6337]|uniref:Uncharacterized protein n=1 Tax=Podila verticillata NRRL 6337 TaxID=1069443 RepID=A0A086TJ85_9FUNG|nr:hypothetical protein MVEG_12166 [Podila verticillata NRRL 6337]
MSNVTTSNTQINSPPEPRFNDLAVTGFFVLGFIGGIAVFIAIYFCYAYYQRKVMYKGRRPTTNTIHPRSRNNFVVVNPILDPIPVPELESESEPILALNSLPQPLPMPPTDAFFDKALPARPSSLIPEMFDPYNFYITSGPLSPTSPRTRHPRRSLGSIVRASVASSTTLGLPLHVPTLAPIPSSRNSMNRGGSLRHLRSVDSGLSELYSVAKRFLHVSHEDARSTSSPSYPSLFSRDTCPLNVLSCSQQSTGASACCLPSLGIIVLSLQWQSDLGPADQFTLHGLWPNNCDNGLGLTSWCDHTRSYTNIQERLESYPYSHVSFMGEMATYWSSYNGNNNQF